MSTRPPQQQQATSEGGDCDCLGPDSRGCGECDCGECGDCKEFLGCYGLFDDQAGTLGSNGLWGWCVYLGPVGGIKLLQPHKLLLSRVCYCLNLVALLLAVLGSMGLSTSSSSLESFAWAQSTGLAPNATESAEVFVGVRTISFQGVRENGTLTFDFKDVDDCEAAEYLCDCHDVAPSVMVSSIFAICAYAPAAALAYLRIEYVDSNKFKLGALAFHFISVVCFLNSLCAFGRDCYGSLPESVEVSSSDGRSFATERSYELGPGFNLFAGAFTIQVFVAAIQFLLPVEQAAAVAAVAAAGSSKANNNKKNAKADPFSAL
eukprot:CAMPEP_0170135130 /NCGR_PEP_ID=MMETSP0033_2-20121228/2322_1 /TAXON_ID=195969 /ORGANISM="Dolichomastix tenuilepis, Strain CCMP3274" /LENGTH=318 /DNA_ID=CAMNT_0010370725 /DNA_START=9 /DNA_END=965 /DNA_ORIENTATION=-